MTPGTATHAGMVGGSLLLNSIRSMMGGSRSGFGAPSALAGTGSSQNPWSDQSGSNLARDAGINDVGSSTDRSADASRAGLFDTASNNDQAAGDEVGQRVLALLDELGELDDRVRVGR